MPPTERPAATGTRRLVAALACRAGGSRLYGKPLQNLALQPNVTVIEHMIALLKTEPVIAELVLGVSEGAENQPFHRIAEACGIHAITGDQVDVLARLIQCGERGEGTDVFRVTTESPFTYFEAIAPAWEMHCANDNSTTQVADLPDGSGFEIIKLDTLRQCHREGSERHRSELCTLYIRENRGKFRVQVMSAPAEVARPGMRLTIDYPEDLVLCRRVYEQFRTLAPRIPLAEIVKFLETRPDLLALVSPYTSAEIWYEKS